MLYNNAIFWPFAGLSAALQRGIASASVTFICICLVVLVVPILLFNCQSKLKKSVLIYIHRLIGSLVLAYFICMCLLEEACPAGYSHCLSYYWSSLVNQVSWIHQTFRRLLPSSVAIVHSVYCSSSSASEVSEPVAGRNNIITSASCSWWCHCARMQMGYLCQWLNGKCYQCKLQPLTPTTNAQGARHVKICALTQAALIAAASYCADPDLVGSGGYSCMLLFPPAPTCTYARPDICTLTFSPCTCGSITDLFP